MTGQNLEIRLPCGTKIVFA